MKKTIIIDCDPGQDDAIAILLALASGDELEVLGITTVAGNVPLALTQRNARLMCELAGFKDMPVYAGCSRPILRPLVTAEHVHGKTGLDGVDFAEPTMPLQDQHGVDFIIDTLLAQPPATVTLCPLGPLTNIALAMIKEPKIIEHIKEIVLMGGAIAQGNTTPAAEFNIYVDPHAARVVFEAGVKLTMIGLDVTHQALATEQRLTVIKELNTPVSEAVVGLLDFFNRYDTKRYGIPGAPLHDPCVIAYLLKPELFSGKDCYVRIETDSEPSMGMTVVDWWNALKQPANTNVLDSIDAKGFYRLLTEALAKL